jgi:hypothetical protein
VKGMKEGSVKEGRRENGHAGQKKRVGPIQSSFLKDKKK